MLEHNHPPQKLVVPSREHFWASAPPPVTGCWTSWQRRAVHIGSRTSGTPGLRARPTAVHAAHPRLSCRVRIQPHHQVRWWHDRGGPHQQQWWNIIQTGSGATGQTVQWQQAISRRRQNKTRRLLASGGLNIQHYSHIPNDSLNILILLHIHMKLGSLTSEMFSYFHIAFSMYAFLSMPKLNLKNETYYYGGDSWLGILFLDKVKTEVPNVAGEESERIRL